MKTLIIGNCDKCLHKKKGLIFIKNKEFIGYICKDCLMDSPGLLSSKNDFDYFLRLKKLNF